MRLVELGPFPSDSAVSESEVAERQALLEQIQPPLSEEEAAQLFALFGPAEDSLFGLKWTVLHLIEGSPGWPPAVFGEATSPWQSYMKDRAQSSGEKSKAT